MTKTKKYIRVSGYQWAEYQRIRASDKKDIFNLIFCYPDTLPTDSLMT
jgi:hypothetical protein